MPEKLISGPRIAHDASRVGAGLSRGESRRRKLNAAAWSGTWPAPGASLDLDFANDRGFVRGIGQGRSMDSLTFTRGSNAFYVGSDGLLKGSVNRLPNTLEATLVAWAAGSPGISIRLNQTEAPDGTVSAASMMETATYLDRGFTTASMQLTAGVETFSIYAKANGRSWIVIRMPDSSGTWRLAWFDIANGVVGTVQTNLTASIVSAGNGWFRCIVTVLTPSWTTGYTVRMVRDGSDPDGQSVPIGDPTKGVYLWGAQVEPFSFATPYNPTMINVPRFDWANTTLNYLNLLQNSERMHLYGANNLVVTANADVSPDGSSTATKIVPTSTSECRLDAPINMAGATVYTVSAYAKSAGYNFFFFRVSTGSDYAVFNLTTGAITVVGSVTNVAMVDVGNGWWRCSATYSNNISVLRIGVSNIASINVSSPNGTSGILVWGAQAEYGAALTPYKSSGAYSATYGSLAAMPTCNGLLIEEARTNRALWCRDASAGTGTNLMLHSLSSVFWNVSNGSIGTLGPELLTNGDFASGSTGWTLGANTSVSGGIVTIGNSGAAGISQANRTQAGKTYRIKLDVVAATAGNDAKFHNSYWAPDTPLAGSPVNNTPGTYTLTLIANNTSFAFGNFNGTAVQLDNISLKEVTAESVADPVGGTTASVAVATGSNATFTQVMLNAAVDSGTYTFSVWMRRKTGAGDVAITCSSTGTWVTQVITSSWARYSVTQTVVSRIPVPGIRIATAGDEVEIWGAQFVPGPLLTTYQPTTGSTLFGWSRTNITAAKDQIGIDGVANSATSLTATAPGGLVCQPLHHAFVTRAASVYLKRLIGTGVVQLSLDGSTWSTVDLSTTEWRRVSLTGSIQNPVLGIRLMTSGDAVAMDFAQIEDGGFETSPIFTTTAAVTRSADVASLSGANFTACWSPRQVSIYSEIISYTGAYSSDRDGVWFGWGSWSWTGVRHDYSNNSNNSMLNVANVTPSLSILFSPLTTAGQVRKTFSSIRLGCAHYSWAGLTSVAQGPPYHLSYIDRMSLSGYNLTPARQRGTIKRLVFLPFYVTEHVGAEITKP